jgi:hypothetical protein
MPNSRRRRVAVIIKRSAYDLAMEQPDDRLHALLQQGDPTVANVMSAHEAHTATVVAIRNQPVLDPHRKDVFTVCLARGEDVLIQDPDDPRILPFIPDWFQRIPGKGPFLLLPVKDSGGTFAIICGTTGKTDRIELNATRLQQLKLLRNHLGAIRSSLVQSRAAA